MPKAVAYSVDIEQFPKRFQEMAKEAGVATNGRWTTFASSPDEAADNCVGMVKIMLRETVRPEMFTPEICGGGPKGRAEGRFNGTRKPKG